MPTLNWIGKEAVVNHHQQVPFHLLKDVLELACGEPGDGNLIVQGDNLVALKALLPYYAGQVKCIYIDPPYNTGNEGWAYNDNVNSPVIREWLGKVVGKEDETLDRHDRWLCMMYPRLVLLKQFLRDDGILFISIGDDELASLNFLLDEIFGRQNQAAIFVWKSRVKPSNIGTAKFKPQRGSEYVLAYSKRPDAVSYNSILSGKTRSYPHQTEDGRKYRFQTILKSNRGENQRDTMRFEIAGFTPPPTQRWQGGEEFIHDLHSRGYIEFRNGIPFRRYFEDEEPDEHSPLYTFIQPEESGSAESGKNLLNEILGNTHGFDTVKPPDIIERLLAATTSGNDIVLDSFGGSGTTGHAVLNANDEDSGSRRFILVEMDENIARNVTSERVRRVAQAIPTRRASKSKVLAAASVSVNWVSRCSMRAERYARRRASQTSRAMFISPKRVSRCLTLFLCNPLIPTFPQRGKEQTRKALFDPRPSSARVAASVFTCSTTASSATRARRAATC